MIEIPSNTLREAGALLNRLRPKRAVLPVLNYVLAEFDPLHGIRLTVTSLDQWLSIRVPATQPAGFPEPVGPESLLIPGEAFEAALKADRGTVIGLTRKGPRTSRRIRLRMVRQGIQVEITHPTMEPDEFPPCPEVPAEARPTVLPGRAFEMMAIVATCSSKDARSRK